MTSQETREELIFQFIKDNPGTSEYRVYHDKKLLKEASKDTIILDINHLVEDKRISIKIETRKNNKIHHLYINDESEFNQITNAISIVERKIASLPEPVDVKAKPRDGYISVPDHEWLMWSLQLSLWRTYTMIRSETDSRILYMRIIKSMIKLTGMRMKALKKQSKSH
jgi:hypothetical protein